MRIDLSNQLISNNWAAQKKIKFIQGLIIAGTILLSAIVALNASQLQFALLLGLFLVSGALLVLLRWPPLGLLMIPIVSIFVPFSGPGGINATIMLVALLLGLWVLDMGVRQHKIQLVQSRTMLPILVFIIISFLSLGIGQFSWYPFARQAPLNAQLGGFVIFVLSAGSFLLVANRIRDLRWLKAVTWFFMFLAGFIYMSQFLSLRIITDLFIRNAFGSMFLVWLVALSSSQAIFNRRLHMVWRIILAGLAFTTLYVGYIEISDWRSGWVPPLVSLVVIMGLFLRKRIWVFLPLLPFALIFVWTSANQMIMEEQYSWITRLEAWKIVLEISKVNPLLGLGFANYYWYTPLFPILGWYVSFNSHSQYIDLIAQLGFLGLACFLWFFWEVGRLSMWLRERVPDGFTKAYVYGVIGGIAGTLVAAALVDWVLPFVYNIGMPGFRASVLAWIFLGGLVSIEQIYRDQTKTTTSG